MVLAEIWGIIEPLLRHVRTTGEATWSEDLMLPLARTGAPEESYFTFTYSPIRDETSGVGGVFCAVVETTDKVIEERRLRLLNALAEAGAPPTPAAACAHAATRDRTGAAGRPFALLYLFDDDGRRDTRRHGQHRARRPTRTRTSFVPAMQRPGRSMTLGERSRVVPLADGPADARGAVTLPIEHSGRRPAASASWSPA